MPRPKSSNLSKPIPVKFPKKTVREIRAAVKKLQGLFSAQDVIRLATALGLSKLRRIDYNVTGVISGAAEKAKR